ncbi:hypothetical protein HYPSUDRAFT_209553 [Hypholoma sublateritium FD-334 SS-4]|uniref:Uncharacterized protein n=1 Tax=Hypholoma sublateritium (strain FD-334 SS-4) TaxID=945553 RepID=A0A0D2N2F7_HYPSF|nr:hypothetical protein HYPSUDRAFT_209553 [Hypholoma sublateritium FD-334 SS-4]
MSQQPPLFDFSRGPCAPPETTSRPPPFPHFRALVSLPGAPRRLRASGHLHPHRPSSRSTLPHAQLACRDIVSPPVRPRPHRAFTSSALASPLFASLSPRRVAAALPPVCAHLDVLPDKTPRPAPRPMRDVHYKRAAGAVSQFPDIAPLSASPRCLRAAACLPPWCLLQRCWLVRAGCIPNLAPLYIRPAAVSAPRTQRLGVTQGAEVAGDLPAPPSTLCCLSLSARSGTFFHVGRVSARRVVPYRVSSNWRTVHARLEQRMSPIRPTSHRRPPSRVLCMDVNRFASDGPSRRRAPR